MAMTTADLTAMAARGEALANAIALLLDGPAGKDLDARTELRVLLGKIASVLDQLADLRARILADYTAQRRAAAPALTADEEAVARSLSTALDECASRVSALQAAFREAVEAGVTLIGMPVQLPDEPDDIFVARFTAWFAATVSAEEPVPTAARETKIKFVRAIEAFYRYFTGYRTGEETDPATLGAHAGLSAWITQIYGAATFGAFILEEAIQSTGLGAWIAYGAEEYDVSESTLDIQTDLLEDYYSYLDALRPLMPLTYPAFLRFGAATGASNTAIRLAIEKKRAGKPPPTTGTLSVRSSPTNAEITLDGAPTGLLTPETFSKLAAGSHTIVLALPAGPRRPAMRADATVQISAGKKAELLVQLEEAT